MVFAINQVDLVEPVDWSEKMNAPSAAQEENIRVILDDRRAKLESVLGRSVKLIQYSGYRPDSCENML